MVLTGLGALREVLWRAGRVPEEFNFKMLQLTVACRVLFRLSRFIRYSDVGLIGRFSVALSVALAFFAQVY